MADGKAAEAWGLNAHFLAELLSWFLYSIMKKIRIRSLWATLRRSEDFELLAGASMSEAPNGKPPQ